MPAAGLHVSNILARYVREIRQQRAGKRAAGSVFESAEVTCGDIEQGEVCARLRMRGIMDDEVKKDEQCGQRDDAEHPAAR